MLEIESGLEHDMSTTRSPTPVPQIGAANGFGRGRASTTFFDLLDDLACGFYGLKPASDETFRDTIPAVCWAVPGAYASPIEC